MKNKLSLSIAIPMYNHERTIRATLNSIFSQLDDIKDVCDLEVVIADNCSTDKSPEIIKTEYLPKYEGILKYFKNEENIGMSRNFNRVAEYSTKEYVWLFGDDLICEKSIKTTCMDILSKNKKFGAILLNCHSSNDITEYPLRIAVESKYSNEIFEFNNISDMSRKIKKTEDFNGSVLQPAFISLLIISRQLWQKYYQSTDANSIFPHLYPYFRITKTHPILFIDKILVINQGALAYQLNNIELQIKTTLDQVLCLKDVFGNIDILSLKDKKVLNNHFINAAILRSAFKTKKYNHEEILDMSINHYTFLTKNELMLIKLFRKLSSKLALYIITMLKTKKFRKKVKKFGKFILLTTIFILIYKISLHFRIISS